MKALNNLRTLLTGAAAAVLLAPAISTAQIISDPDASFDPQDIVLFFRNPNGTTGTDQVLTFSLGSSWNKFRAAATPGNSTYGATIFLGNISANLTTAYGTDWTSLSANSTIFSGAVGQNGNTSQLATTVTDGDYARTVYFTRARTAAGTAGTASSAGYTQPAGASAQQGLASNIATANNVMLSQPNPYQVGNLSTIFDDQNPISGTNVPGIAFTQIGGGVVTRLQAIPQYALGPVSNIVSGMDLYRATPVANASGSWEQANSITGVSSRVGYFLGTLTLSSNGDVHFVAIPEPGTAGLLLVAGVGSLWLARRRRQNQLS